LIFQVTQIYTPFTGEISVKIYTKRGDAGQTSLLGANSISKAELRVKAYGDIDELNSFCGLLISEENAGSPGVNSNSNLQHLTLVQNRLFALGSQLACVDEKMAAQLPEVKTSWITDLENEIDKMTSELPKQTQFIVPGGTKTSSLAHCCRTICRRAERQCVELAEFEDLQPNVIPYINRLSDYFQVLARWLNHKAGIADVFWKKE
jgi:cob(I)alamin adenosyltransferase